MTTSKMQALRPVPGPWRLPYPEPAWRRKAVQRLTHLHEQQRRRADREDARQELSFDPSDLCSALGLPVAADHADSDDRALARAARHEAAHALVLCVTATRFGGAYLVPEPEVRFDGEGPGETGALADRVCVMLAGAASEERWGGVDALASWPDLQVALSRADGDADLVRRQLDRTRGLLHTHADGLTALSMALLQERELSADRCRAILRGAGVPVPPPRYDMRGDAAEAARVEATAGAAVSVARDQVERRDGGDFDEEKHPRDEQGKFAAAAAAAHEATAKAEREGTPEAHKEAAKAHSRASTLAARAGDDAAFDEHYEATERHRDAAHEAKAFAVVQKAMARANAASETAEKAGTAAAHEKAMQAHDHAATLLDEHALLRMSPEREASVRSLYDQHAAKVAEHETKSGQLEEAEEKAGIERTANRWAKIAAKSAEKGRHALAESAHETAARHYREVGNEERAAHHASEAERHGKLAGEGGAS